VGVESARGGKVEAMSESDPAEELEHEADELEHHLNQLDDQIADAEKAADRRREDVDPDVAGDWKDTRGTAGQGEDPEGAVDDESVGGPTPGDADGGDD
jgi:septal ring factor EnvC (AmiA/AmiB activator)